MIFLTVGSQLAFDRLTKKVDEWAGDQSDIEIFAQIGITDFKPKNMEYSALLEPEEYINKLESAEIIISHAGMGTIITALEYHKPLLIMPRKANLSETRNDHQIPTARHFSNYDLIETANDENMLIDRLSCLIKIKNQEYGAASLTTISPELVNGIREFLHN